MAENEQLRQQEQSQSSIASSAAAAKEQGTAYLEGTAIKGTEALCKHCGAALEPDLPFCTTCGEKIGGDELLCEFCKTKTSKDICPHCGRRVVPLNCIKCGAASIYDACENCGAILNPSLEKLLSQEASADAAAEPAQMSAQEAAEIEKEFKAMESFESAEFKTFQKKLIERQVLLEERDYFNKREKRIIKVFGSQPFTLELPDPEEEAFRMKVYAALEKTVIEREDKAIEDELNKLFPPVTVIDTDTSAEDARLAEIEKNRAEMERKFNEALANVNNEVETFRIEEERKRLEEERRRLEEERKRLEEERRRKEEEARREAEAERQRQMEIERRRLEEERRRKRINGSFYYYNNDFEMTLHIAGNSKGSASYHCFVCRGSAYLDFNVNFDGTNVKLRCNCLSNNTCGVTSGLSSGHNDDRLNFTGSLNASGTMLTGYWGSGRGAFRSQFGGGADASATSGTFYKR